MTNHTNQPRLNPQIHVKVCGLTNLEDAWVAVEAGADLLGFILYAKSPRYTPPEQIGAITQAIRDRAGDRAGDPVPRFVGVFVDATADELQTTLSIAGLDYAQLQGAEPPEVLVALDGRAYKALRPTSVADAQEAAARYAALGTADGPSLLIDAYDAHEYGGTGKKADWHAAATLARAYPRLMLAGGLNPSNVAQAIRTVQPWAVDVASGVEIEPRRKDHEAVRSFVRQAKETFGSG